jgi:hypothetical protein
MSPVVIRALEGADTEDGETRLLRVGADDDSTAKGPFPLLAAAEQAAPTTQPGLPPISTSLGDTDHELTTFYSAGATAARAGSTATRGPSSKLLVTPLAAVAVGFAIGVMLLAVLLRYPPAGIWGPASSPGIRVRPSTDRAKVDANP